MGEVVSIFNERFTELADEMQEKTLNQKWKAIFAGTGIPEKTLRKYYIAPHDDEYTSNRIKAPSHEYIEKLADFFKVSPMYLAGTSDVRNLDTENILKTESESGLTEDIIEHFKQISQLPDKRIYYTALEWLLKDIEPTTKTKERHPYHLLFLIGKYFDRLYGRQQAILSPKDIEDLQQLLSRQYSTLPTLKDYASRIVESATEQPENPDPRYLSDIEEELKLIRSHIDYIQIAVFKIILQKCQASEGSEIIEDYNIEASASE